MSDSKILEKTKIPKFGNPNALLGIFDQECLIWVFQVKNFQKNQFFISNQHPQICQTAKFCQKKKP